MPLLLHGADPAKISFLKTSTRLWGVQAPDMVIGELAKCCPGLGLPMVAAVLGGDFGTLPVRPIDPASGPGLAPATLEMVQAPKTKPTTNTSSIKGKYDVCSCGLNLPL